MISEIDKIYINQSPSLETYLHFFLLINPISL